MSEENRPNRRILFLEDEVLLTLTFEDVLRELKLGELIVANSIDQAYRALDDGPVDIAVLDLNVNGSSSVPIAQLVAANGGEVIFATGQTGGNIDVSTLKADLLPKPYQESALRNAVLKAHRALLGRSAQVSA
jgi:DNA-binding response OmpR family regulator